MGQVKLCRIRCDNCLGLCSWQVRLDSFSGSWLVTLWSSSGYSRLCCVGSVVYGKSCGKGQLLTAG